LGLRTGPKGFGKWKFIYLKYVFIGFSCMSFAYGLQS
jgi:hypothetical protein